MCERCEPRSHSISRWSMPLDCTENAYKNSTWLLNCHFLQTSLYGPTQWPLYTFDVHSVKWQTLQTATWNSDRLSSFCCCNRYCWCKTSRKKPLRTINIALVTLRRRHLYHRTQRRNQRFQCSRAPSQAEPPVTQAHYLYHVRDSYNMSKYREHVGRSLGLEICQKKEKKSMKLTMWRVVVVLNMHTKFRGK